MTNELKAQFDNQLKEICDLELKLYRLKYPTEELQNPEIIFSFDFKQDAINTYKEFGYTDEYISNLNNRANWNTTAGLTIFKKKMGLPPRIIINYFLKQEDTVEHELTHVSDYYGYCKRNGYLDTNSLEFIQMDTFWTIYLFSEFRAHYRCGMNFENDIEKTLVYSNEKIKQQSNTLESYYYDIILFTANLCVLLDKKFSKEIIPQKIKERNDAFLSFLYPLRNKSFEELEKHIEEFQTILHTVIE